MSGYDTWLLNGPRHKCACGRSYFETDGPCHEICRECGNAFGEEETLVDGLCESCTRVLAVRAMEEAAEAGV